MEDLKLTCETYSQGELLYRECCNLIYLGQVELARAYAISLENSETVEKNYKQKLKETLKNISRNPFLVRNSWSTFSSPSFTSFLASQVLAQITSNMKVQKEISVLRGNAEFSMMLEELLHDLSERSMKELSRLYIYKRNPHEVGPSPNEEDFFKLEEGNMKRIKDTVFQDPAVISVFFNQLCVSNTSIILIYLREKLRDVYVECLLECFKLVESSFLKDNVQKLTEHAKKAYFFLSLIPKNVFDHHVSKNFWKRFDEVLSVIVFLCDSHALCLDNVYIAMLSRSSPTLLQRFCEKEDNLFKEDNDTSFLSCLGIDLIVKDGTLILERILLHSIGANQHFIEILLNFSVEKLLRGDFLNVKKFLHNVSVERLLPLILVLSWNSCSDDGSFENVMQAMQLWEPDEKYDAVLVETCRKFLTYVSFKERCINYFKRKNPNIGSKEIMNKAQNIFAYLQTQTPLMVIQKVFGLKHVDTHQVMELLRYSTPNSEHSLPVDNSSVTYAKDSVIFHAYLAIISVMEAIFICCEFNQLLANKNYKVAEMQYEEIDTAIPATVPGGFFCKSILKQCLANYGMEVTYKKYIVERLELVRQEIKKIYPLTFRVEILENIFSLLFLSSNDLKDLSVNFSDSDEGHEGEERSIMTKEISPSFISTKQMKSDFSFNTTCHNAENEDETQYTGRFIVSKVKLKDITDDKKELSEIQTSHPSSRSTGSSDSKTVSIIGFLSCEIIVRDLLSLLKDAIVNIDAELFKARGESGPVKNKVSGREYTNNNSVVPSSVKTSIQQEKIQKRISILRQYIDEANWRYELVESSHVLNEANRDRNAVFFSTNSRPSQTKTKSSSVLNEISKSSRSATDVGSGNLSSTDNFEANHNEARSVKRKRKRKKFLRSPSSVCDRSLFESSIIQRMLSFPDALLRHCLWQQNFDKANQVIGLCQLHSSPEAKELSFAEELDKVCLKIKKTQKFKENIPKNILPDSQKTSIIPDIIAIAKAAASGLQSTAASSVLEQEIDKKRIPPISEIDDKFCSLSPFEQELLEGSTNLYSIVLADLGYTRGLPLDHCLILLDMAVRRWNGDSQNQELLLKKGLNFIRSNFKTIQMFLTVLKDFQFFEADAETKPMLRQIFFPQTLNLESFSECFMNYFGQFENISLGSQIKLWKHFNSCLEGFVDALCYEGDSVKTEQPDNFSGKHFNSKNKLHILYKNLLKSTMELHSWSTEIVQLRSMKYVNYLKKLYTYLQQVTEALLGCKDQNIALGTNTYTSYFSALNESSTEILRKMIVQNKISPEKIEKFALCMKVDLSHILVESYFPSVFMKSESDHSSFSSAMNSSHEPAMIVLNKSEQKWSHTEHPDTVARKLMIDLVKMIQDIAIAKTADGIISIEAFKSLLEHSEMSDWMNDCGELAHVDLDLLKTKQEILAFFVNVTNIAWIHALLHDASIALIKDRASETSSSFKKENNGGDSLRCPIVSPCLSERLVRQKSVGYSIGQLGDISLFDLRYILHLHFPAPKHLSEAPFHVLLNDSKSHFESNPSWSKYAPPAESKLLFVLCEGLLCSTKLEVMFSEKIEDQLVKSMEDFLNFNVTVDVINRTIELPRLLELYLLDFVEEKKNHNESLEGLLNLLTSFLKPDTAASVEKLLSLETPVALKENEDNAEGRHLPCIIHFKPHCLKPGILLQYSAVANNVLNALHVPKYLSHAEPTILKFLQNRCSIIFNLYEFIANEFVGTEYGDSEVKLYDESTTLDNISLQMPVIRLLKQRKSMAMESLGFPDGTFEWFVSALSQAPLTNFVLDEVEAFCLNAQWENAVCCIDLHSEFKNKLDFCFVRIRQMLLQYMADCSPNALQNAIDPWCCAVCLSNARNSCSVVLKNVQKWPCHYALQYLKYCSSNKSVKEDKELLSQLEGKMKEIGNYQKILEASKRVGSADEENSIQVFNNWQDVSEYSIWDQSVVLDCIKSSGQYSLIVEWTKHHVIDSCLKLNALCMQIIWHLNVKPPEVDAVSQVLERCSSTECIELSELVLQELVSIESKLCFVQLLTDVGLEYDDQHRFSNMVLGLKILDAVKSAVREHYQHLIAYPDLILEQLLMNMEIVDVDRALKAISSDLKSEACMNTSVSILFVNQLLENYASKSLELSTGEDSNVSSMSNTTILDSEEVDFAAEQFVMPVNVPTKAEWVPDSRVRICQVCSEEPFNMFSRRHHCRRCGRVVCANCSQNALIVQGYGNVEVRVCDSCYNQTIYNSVSGSVSSPFKSSSLDKRYRMLSSMKTQNLRHSPSLSSYETADFKRRASSIANSELFHWSLTPDTEQNIHLRNQFSYDSAPSVSLCLSILKLHSNASQCAKCMLTLCDRLINKIRPKPSGKLNTEVDFYLIISMIRSLLVNAKVKYHQLQDSDGEQVVDEYFQRLDIIKMLVNANCTHRIPREDVLSTEVVRKLRDRLLEEERMALALDISATFGLDKHGVWSSWGMFCLRAGDWAVAREKFRQCLKVLEDRNKPKQESSVLKSIISCLENTKCAGGGKAPVMFRALVALQEIQCGKTMCETGSFDESVKEECLYYLNTYGSHFSTVSFYQRHGMLSDALNYILDEKCDTEVFTVALFIPTMKCAQLSTLQHLLMFSDCTLSKWWPYLISTCRHLQRLQYSNVLYQMQIFMEDYIRAAKSSINFYLAPASSYITLFERYHFLHNARKHFETYLKNETSSQQASYVVQNKNFLTLPLDEVESNIRTIKLQEEVSHFFQLCDLQNFQALACNAKSIFSKSSTESLCPPTLFGNRNQKSEIATMVLVNATKVDEGFDLAVKVMKECQLNVSSVVCAAGQQLVKLQWTDQIPHFLHNVKCCFADNVNLDEVIMECITCLLQQNGDVDFLIKSLTSDTDKINAYLMCGKLKSAYLLAIKLHRPLDVHRIMIAAEKSGQAAIKRFCEKWLLANAQKPKSKA